MKPLTPTAVAKMTGAGNDFVVLTGEAAAPLRSSWDAWVRGICRRRLSVGADGVLVVEPLDGLRVRVEFFNPDASPAFCGNGSRCAARFAHHQGWVGSSMVLATIAGDVPARVRGANIELELPAPHDRGAVDLDFGSQRLEGRRIDSPTPHVVCFVPAVEAAPLELWGPAVRRDARFAPAGTNFDLVERRGDARLALRTWERGVEGETLACGSGAVAAAFAARLAGAPASLQVVPASGVPLEVSFAGRVERPTKTLLAGEARFVWEGRIGAEALDDLSAVERG